MPPANAADGSSSNHSARGFSGNGKFNEWCSTIRDRRPASRYTGIDYDCTKLGQGPAPHENGTKFIRGFTHVKKLRLQGATLQYTPEFTVLGPNIISLTLIKCSMDIDELLTFLLHFTGLIRLKISSPVFTEPHPPVTSPPNLSPKNKSSPKQTTALTPLPIQDLLLLGTPLAADHLDTPHEKLKGFLALSNLKVVEIDCSWGFFDMKGMKVLQRVDVRGSTASEVIDNLEALLSRPLKTINLIFPRRYLGTSLSAPKWTNGWDQLDLVLRQLTHVQGLTRTFRLIGEAKNGKEEDFTKIYHSMSTKQASAPPYAPVCDGQSAQRSAEPAIRFARVQSPRKNSSHTSKRGT